MKKIAFLLLLLIFVAPAAFAATTVTVTQPTDANYLKDGAFEVQFTVLDDTIPTDLDANLYYGQAGAVTTVIVNDLNLFTDGQCSGTDFTSTQNCTYSWTVSETTDGNYFLTVELPDANGTGNSFYIDNNAPTAYAIVPDTDYNSSDQNVFFSCSDAGSGFSSFTIGGSSYDHDGVWVNYDSNSGVSFTCTDALGNVSDSNYLQVLIDKAGPTIGGKVPAADAAVSDATPDINFSITDAGSGVAPIATDVNVIIIDGNIIALADLNIFGTTDGNIYSYNLPYAKEDGATVTIYVDVNDSLENNTSDTWSFTINTSGPSISSISIDDNSGYTNDPTPLITLEGVSGGQTHLALSCNGTDWKGWQTYAATVTDFSLTTSDYGCPSGDDGAFTIYLKLKDVADNESSTVNDNSHLDRSGPGTVSNLTAEAGNHEVRLEWDSATDAENYRIYVDGDYNKDTTSTSTTVSGLTNGTEYDFKIRAVDRADNTGGWSSTASATPVEDGDTTVDITDPEVSWVAPSNNATVSGTVELKVDATDDDSGMYQVKFYVDNVIIENVTGKTGGYYVLDWNSASVSDGSHTLKALALDRAANANSASTTRSITVDNGTGGGDSGPTGDQGEAETAIDAAEAAKQEIDDLVDNLEHRGITISDDTQDAIDAAQTKLDNAGTQFDAENYTGAKNLANSAKTGFETALTMLSSEEYSAEDYTYNAENASALLQGMGLNTGLVTEAMSLTGNFNVQRSLEISKIIDGNKTNYVTNVKIVISNVDGNNEIKVVEFIPKEFVDDASKIFSNFTFEIIESDPIIAFNVDVPAGETVEIFYGLGTELATKADADSTIEKKLMAKFLVPPVLLNKETSLDEQTLNVTGGAALGAVDFVAILYGLVIIVVIVIVGFVIVFVASHLTKGKKERPFGLHSVVEDKPLHKRVVQKVKNVMPAKSEEAKKPKWAYKG